MQFQATKLIKSAIAFFALVALIAAVISPEGVLAALVIGALGVPAARVVRAKRGIESKGHRGPQRIASGVETTAYGLPVMAGAAGRLIEVLNFYNACPSSIIAANEDIFNGDPASDVVSMAGYYEMLFVIVKNAGATGTAVVTVESCDDVTPTTSTAIPFQYKATTSVGNTEGALTAAAAGGFTTTAGADQMYVISVLASELQGEDGFVRLQLTEGVDSPCDGAVFCIGGTPRVAGGILRDMTAA